MLLKNLGKYEIIQWLGGGRFGDVFLAWDTILERNFALKISRMRKEEMTMLKDEAKLLASLDHCNIVRFYNIDIIENKFVMIMEYVAGNNLRDIICEGGIDTERSAAIILQILEALVYAHSNNVLHRDLKPENILITAKDEPGVIKITDFGLAKFIRSGSISASSAGTPIYMAPETWAGSFSDKSDIWSLGVICYELLTGVPPYLDDSLEGLQHKIEKAKFLAPSVLRHEIPEYLETIILESLKPNPKARPSASELSERMKRHEAGVRTAKGIRLTGTKVTTTQLSSVQKEVLQALDKPVLLLGQAGCGKTTTLISAVNALLKQGIPVSNILICTFTNKAANDIKQRLEKSVEFSPYDLWLGTLHTLGFRILRRDAERLDISTDFIITEPKKILLDMHIKTGKYRVNAIARFIENLKARGITVDTFKPKNSWEKLCKDIYQEYHDYSREKNIIDFDDLILLSVKLLEDNEDIRQYYQDLFEYIFVDELQDMSPAQYRLINLIVKKRVFFTGDEDQAIYGWRGADRKLIHRIPKDYKNVQTFSLSRSFRLAQGIIDLANSLMRREATIIPGSQSADTFLYAAKSEQAEADYIVKEIRSLKKDHFDYQDVAILYRMNHLARVYKQALVRARIPHAVIGGSSFYERADAKPIIEYLELLERSSLKNEEPDGFLHKASSIFNVPAKNRPRAEKIYKHHLTDLGLLGPDKLVEDIIDVTGIQGASIDELRWLARNRKSHDLSGFLNEIRLIQELDLVDWGKDAVKLMTIHNAKGLEFPVVFVVDLVEDTFPLTKKMSSQKEIDEERRLCYVALTRAQKKLYLLYPKWHQGRYQHASRFLIDMFKTPSS